MTNVAKRLDELDILRGISVIGMLMVIMPGDWQYRFQWLNHAAWNGYPLVDMISPSFLFCVGVAIPISLSKRFQTSDMSIFKHLFVRCFLLVIIGIFTNGFPHYDIPNIRIPGILQRIGLSWLIVSSIFLIIRHKSLNNQVLFLAGTLLIILIGYWVLLTFIPVPGFGSHRYDSIGSWPAYIDRLVFGVNHLWIYGTTNGVVTYDPDGLLSTIPVCANMIVGSIITLLYLNQSPYYSHKNLIFGGLFLMALGWSLDITGVLPINKSIWTSSFALFSTGFSVLLLGLIGLSLKIERIRLNYGIAKVFGSNALLAFVASAVLGTLLDQQVMGGLSSRNLGFNFLNALIPNPNLASFIFTILLLALFYWVLLKLHQRKIYWSV